MRHYWDVVSHKVDAMSLRERAILFCIAALLMALAINALLLDPLLVRQKAISAQLVQQEQEMHAAQDAIQAIMQAKRETERSPVRERIAQLKLQLQASGEVLKSRRDHLVEPGKMADLLEQVLRSNDKVQLVELKTLPLSLLAEPKADGKVPLAQQIYKHGVQISLRGNYLDLLRYLTALEKLPDQMFWAEVSLSVETHPDALLTLTVYTLSLDKTWLTV